jgi:hypothetical protein
MVHNASADDKRLEERYWHEHVNFFSERSLAALPNICGLSIVGQIVLNVRSGDRENQAFGVAAPLAST